ncbi:NADH-ubiquinone oxidoreductase-F iron-sulfur binding region domain-containing protein [Thermodesulfitimonas sp.]
MCSGGAIPRCIVDLSEHYLGLVLQEACSDCPVCTRELKAMQQLLRRIGRGEGGRAALTELKLLSSQAREAAACGVGRVGASIVASALLNYEDELAAHVVERYCPAGVCDIRYVVEVG